MLRIEGVTAGYTQVPIITDITIVDRPGSIVAILGPNGCGKSTLLKAIMGLLKPMAGKVTLSETVITGWAPNRIVRLGMGYVPQSKNVFPSLTVVENLEMGAFIKSGKVLSRVEAVLEDFPDLLAARGKKAGNLSVGQRNLLGLARALMSEPAVILVDEPTAGLAPSNIGVIWSQLLRIAARGASVVVVEQNVDMALQHSEWAYVLVAGRNRLEGPSADLQGTDLHSVFLGRRDGMGLTERLHASNGGSSSPSAPSGASATP